MKKYYLIRSLLTMEFWNEEKQSFDSLANGTKYRAEPRAEGEKCNTMWHQLTIASKERICTVETIYVNK